MPELPTMPADLGAEYRRVIPKWVRISESAWLGAVLGYAAVQFGMFLLGVATWRHGGFTPRSLDYLQMATWAALTAWMGWRLRKAAREILDCYARMQGLLGVIGAQAEILNGRAMAHFRNPQTGDEIEVDLSKSSTRPN